MPSSVDYGAAMPDTPGEWWIGLAAWVLRDGNYTDFAVGQVRQFALEFGYDPHDRLRPTATLRCRAQQWTMMRSIASVPT